MATTRTTPRRYRRHVPLDLDKRVRGYRTLRLEWSREMAYIVGLLATDGCLSRDRRHIVLTSRDLPLIEDYLRLLGRPIRYRVGRTRRKKRTFYAQFSDVAFYDWLLSVGLTPQKSLTLGAIDVPERYFLPLVRGLLDGDGSISSFEHRPTRKRYPNYVYRRLWVFFLSASPRHIEWLQARLENEVGVSGRLKRVKRKKRHDLFRLKFGNRESEKLLRLLYADRAEPCLERKRQKWDSFLERAICAGGGI